jgi:hypothetical protein
MQAWAEEHEEDCEVEGGEQARRAAPDVDSEQHSLAHPPTPSLSANRTGNSVLVRYNLPPGGASPSYILLTVTAKNQLVATRSKEFRLHASHGTAACPSLWRRVPT